MNTLTTTRKRSAAALLTTCALLLLAGIVIDLPTGASGQTDGREPLPPGVTVETVLEEMQRPVAMAFDPSGRLFYTEKTGAVRLFANGQLQPDPVIYFSVNEDAERGLIGIAIDPDFNENHYIYVYYTCMDGGPGCGNGTQNRVVRFVERDGVGSDPTIIFSAPQTVPVHAGGNIHFGPDGKLYVSVGDNGAPANAQNLTTKNGKIHRINPDGTAPDDNPVFEGEGALPTIYAIGLRNSFDFTFDPVVKGRIFAGENGPGCDDELNRIEAGFNYGWRPDYPCEDDNPDPRFNTINPIWYVEEASCCVSPTGILVYTSDQIPEWRNHLFLATYNSGALFRFRLNDERTAMVEGRVIKDVNANVDIEIGPDGALYFIEGGGWRNGTLKRLVGTGQQPAGTAIPTRTPRPTVTPQVAPTTIPGAESLTFQTTGQIVSGIFLDYWRNNGGLMQQGFPISGLMGEVSDLDGKPYTVQYFERAVFEYHPEQTDPRYQVLLSQLGTFEYTSRYPEGAPNQQANTSSGSILFPETGKRLGGKFLEYWRNNGGLMQQGLPISDEFAEVSELDGKVYRVQYFERAVFEMHPEQPDPRFQVLLSQLGTFRYHAQYGMR